MTNENDAFVQDDLQFSAEDLSMPRWKIDKSGNFANTMTGEIKSLLNVVPVRADVSRFYWPPEFKPDNLPICYSSNAITPDVNNPVSAHCVDCPAALWTDEKPRCAKSYNYLLLDIETDILSILNLSRARTPTARALNSFFRLNGVKFTLQFSTSFERTQRGEFWQVCFTILHKNPDWYEYARMISSNRGLLLTGGVSTERETIAEEIVNVETGEFEF